MPEYIAANLMFQLAQKTQNFRESEKMPISAR